ncbi:MAG: hypothetical protein ABI467_04755 [Kofleriaceae bacterium]
MTKPSFLFIALVGCGKVAAVADGSIDAPLPDALTCSAAQELCNATCSDPMSAVDHCGSCDNACATDHETCQAGHCVDYTATCATIHAGNPAAVSGPYTLLDTSIVFCDFEHNVTYTQLAFGQYNVAHPGYALVSAADLADPTVQKAFIYLFNSQSGAAISLGTFTSMNCCIADNANGADLLLGGAIVYPATPNSTTAQCSPAGGYTLSGYGLTIQTAPAVFTTATLPDDFFTTSPASEGANCGPSNNPALFWKRAASS